MKPELNEVGEALKRQADEGNLSPKQILSELFPYVYQAAERMSTRAVSLWLKETHGIQISQPTIVRALRNPDKHWRYFAEFVEPVARKVEKCIEPPLEVFLFDEQVFAHSIIQPVYHCDREHFSRAAEEFHKAVEFLKTKWFSLDEEIRSFCWKYLQPGREEEEEGRGDE